MEKRNCKKRINLRLYEEDVINLENIQHYTGITNTNNLIRNLLSKESQKIKLNILEEYKTRYEKFIQNKNFDNINFTNIEIRVLKQLENAKTYNDIPQYINQEIENTLIKIEKILKNK